MLLRATFAALLLCSVAPLQASVAADDLMIPVVGRATSADGREYRTQIHLVSSGKAASVLLTFRASDAKDNPVSTRRELPAGGALIVDADRGVLGREQATGSLRIESSEPIIAVARITMHEAHAPDGGELSTTFQAVPVERAIASGESANIPGLGAGEYKLYLAEVSGQPLHVEVEAVATDGRVAASQRVYVDASQQVTVRLASSLKLAPGFLGYVRVTGVNGSGKVVAAGEFLPAGSRDSCVFNMELPLEPRHRLSNAEMILYAAIALVLLVALFHRR